ncbi:MAG: TolC family protein [Akkermansiaceae bacterium]|nr:TolC family protein [Akkermansiaceae bacterium]
MNSILPLLAGLTVAANLLHAGTPQPLNESFLTTLRAEAARTHPSATAAKHQAEAASQNVRGIRLWDDPMVGLGFMAAEPKMRQDQGDIMIGIGQNLPKPGLFAAQRNQAAAIQRATEQSSRTAPLTAAAEAARNAIELALADESITLQQTQINWLAAMAENARQKAADPTGTGSDALRMETELAREQQLLDAARRNRDAFAQQLNLTLGRPLESAWPTLQLPATPPPVPVATAEISRIPYVNPKVRAMKEMAGAAKAGTRIADRDRLPQMAVGIDSRIYSGGDLRSTTLGISMSLPWFNDPSYQARIHAAKDLEAAATQDVETARREIAAMVLTAATEAANAAAQARAYAGEIHDKALQARQSIEAAWISSKAPLTDLLDASRTLFAIDLEQRRMIAMQLAALEELQTLVPHR